MVPRKFVISKIPTTGEEEWHNIVHGQLVLFPVAVLGDCRVKPGRVMWIMKWAIGHATVNSPIEMIVTSSVDGQRSLEHFSSITDINIMTTMTGTLSVSPAWIVWCGACLQSEEFPVCDYANSQVVLSLAMIGNSIRPVGESTVYYCPLSTKWANASDQKR